MKLTDIDNRTNLEESYMQSLEVRMPVLTLKKGVGSLIKELTGKTVKELKITSQLYLVYTGKLPSKSELANLIQSRFGVTYEKAVALLNKA